MKTSSDHEGMTQQDLTMKTYYTSNKQINHDDLYNMQK